MNNLLKLILIVICLSSCNQSLEKRAENGDPHAQYELAMYYIDSLPRNTMDVSRQAEGVHLLRLASNQNHSAAQFEFARCYMSGLIVDRDTDEAIKWFVKSAQSGYVDAQLILGRVYSSGEDVEQDYEQREKLYIKAAEAGHITAMSELGSIYYYGEEGGVEKDIQKSFDWSMKAARQGDYKGRYNCCLLL